MNLPGNTDRLATMGATGSGKTTAATYNLSLRPFDRYPWYVVDFKYDDLINSIEGAQHVDSDAPIATEPGIYIVHPEVDNDDQISDLFKRIWQNEHVGVYIDESYMIAQQNKAHRALLTQGRSKHIPMIILSQRPTWIDRFVLSEASFIQVFRMSDEDDLKRVSKFMGRENRRRVEQERLPEFYSYWYDVKANKLDVLKPVPDGDAILDSINFKLSKIRKVA